jgi:hypothetical protein
MSTVHATADARERLAEFERMTHAETFAARLRARAGFHDYSYANVCLIVSQRGAADAGRRLQDLAEARPAGPQGRARNPDPRPVCRNGTRRGRRSARVLHDCFGPTETRWRSSSTGRLRPKASLSVAIAGTR